MELKINRRPTRSFTGVSSMSWLLAWGCALVFARPGTAQDHDSVPSDSVVMIQYGCGFSGIVEARGIVPLAPHKAFQATTVQLLQIHGLTPTNLKLFAAQLYPNEVALADVDAASGFRRVFYNRKLSEPAPDPLPVGIVGVLAHEVGHQLLGHTLRLASGRKEEDEADFFAGHVLRYLGYGADSARAFMLTMAPPVGTQTHRPAGERADIVLTGWRTADDFLARDHEHAPGWRQISQQVVTTPPVANPGLVRREWVAYIRFRGDPVALPISADGRIYRPGTGDTLSFIGTQLPPRTSEYAWSWEGGGAAIDVARDGVVYARLPTGTVVRVGVIVAPVR